MDTPSLPRRLARGLLPGLAGLTVLSGLLSGGFGLVEIEPGEAAVVYNTTGLSLFGDSSRVIRDQGTFTFIPWLQRVEKVDIRPQVLTMEGTSSEKDGNHIDRLDVRARDGSSLWFDRLEIHYQVNPAALDRLIRANGRGDAYKGVPLAVHSREVLRNEFGRFSFLELADPSTYGLATTAARQALNARLEPWGVTVTQIITPKPRFREEVESAIEARQTAEQEVEVQREKRARLEKQRERQILDVRQTKNSEEKSLLATLEGLKKEAENAAVATRREADKYAIGETAQCTAERDAAIERARANEVAYRKDAEALAAKIAAVGSRGSDVLNLTIAEHVFPQLERIKARPYAQPATPIDLRYLKED